MKNKKQFLIQIIDVSAKILYDIANGEKKFDDISQSLLNPRGQMQ